MPLVRFQVRNEYGFGDPELYKATEKDESKSIFEGVAVSGLVGILRQLGDLAEFAAEIFQDLHAQMTATAARSYGIGNRVKRLEAGLPSLEKAVLAQTSHIHFAYIAGCDWRANVRTEQNLLTRGDLPKFIMDSYEECRGPPRLFLLDKFDAAGPGACLKRYTDPSFFKMEWATSEIMKAEQIKREKKAQKQKRRMRRRRQGEAQDSGTLSLNSDSKMSSSFDSDDISYEAVDLSTFDMRLKSKKFNRDQSFASTIKPSYMERLLDVNGAEEHEKIENTSSGSFSNMQFIGEDSSILPSHHAKVDAEAYALTSEENVPLASRVTWEEKTEVLPSYRSSPYIPNSEHCTALVEVVGVSQFESGEIMSSLQYQNQLEIKMDYGSRPGSCARGSQAEDIASEPDNYEDALNTMESEVETDSELRAKREKSKARIRASPARSMTHKQDHGYRRSSASDIEFQPSLKASPARSVTAKQEHVRRLSGSSDIEYRGSLRASPARSVTEKQDYGHRRSSASDIDFETSLKASPARSVTNKQEHVRRLSGSSDIEYKVTPKASPARSVAERQNHEEGYSGSFEVIIPGTHDGLEPPTGADAISSHDFIHPPQAESAAPPSIKCWTNGGLLGLEPSKPPAFATSTLPQDNISDQSGGHPQSSRVLSDANGGFEVAGLLKLSERDEEGSNQLILFTDEGQKYNVYPDDMLTKVKASSQKVVPLKNAKNNRIKDIGLEETSGLFSRAELPILSDVEMESTISGTSGGHKINEHKINGFDQELVIGQTKHSGTSRNMMNRTVHLPHQVNMNSRSNESKKVKSSSVHTTNANATSAPAGLEPDDSKLRSRTNSWSPGTPSSGCPSPPLEHMKISFQRIDDLEVSALKLDFPGEHNFQVGTKGAHSQHVRRFSDPVHHENSKGGAGFLTSKHKHAPSVPYYEEKMVPKRAESENDSDDDTFRKPSLSFSDDMLSQQSDSNSEQWEYGDRNSGNEDLYDGLHRVPSTASMASSAGDEASSHHHERDPEIGKSHRVNHKTSNYKRSAKESTDNPDAVIDHSETEVHQKYLAPSNHFLTSPAREPTPPLPPLPPKQWKPTIYETQAASQTKTLPPEKSLMRCITSHDKSTLRQTKVLTKTESSQQPGDKQVFLEQIRAKSFSLRRTVTTSRPAFMPGPAAATNINVAAILEKANAIRQAFTGSDESDSESWSDE